MRGARPLAAAHSWRPGALKIIASAIKSDEIENRISGATVYRSLSSVMANITASHNKRGEQQSREFSLIVCDHCHQLHARAPIERRSADDEK